MESMSVTPETHPKRGIFARLLAALVIGVSMVKAFLFLAFDYLRGLAVNPFEGFGLTQFAVAGGSMALSMAAYAIVFREYPLALVFGFLMIIFIHEIGHAIVIRAKGLRPGLMVF